MTTYEEWRVTGTPLKGLDAYDRTWSSARDSNAEKDVRDYVAWARTKDWHDGPHLHKRTVTVTDWEAIEP
jgi:hypothetical protein